MDNIKPSSFATKDLYEASYIYSKGATFVGVNGASDSLWFVFADRKKCEHLSSEYWSKKGVVVGKDYSEAIRTLKDLIFSKKR